MGYLSKFWSIGLVGLLAACGGGNSDQTPDAAHAVKVTAVVPRAAATTVQLSDYRDVVQELYVAYFGRPADPAGLTYYESELLAASAPTTLAELLAAYNTNPIVKAVIDSFSTSAESAALYPGSNNIFIDEVYTNLFNRVADSGGGAYWSGLLTSGKITKANASLSIMGGAASTDITLVQNKKLVAVAFTENLNTEKKAQAYSGLSANAVIRTLLANVAGDTDVANYQSVIDAAIASLIATATPPVVTPPIVTPPVVTPPIVTPPTTGKMCYVNGYYRKNGTYVHGYWRSC